MAARDEQYTSSDDEGGRTKAKRRKGPKACDVCRRKKSDPDPTGDTQRPCVNCAVFKTACTYTYIAKKRKTQQAYIDALQRRLTKAEQILAVLAPHIDLSKELDDSNDITYILSNLRRDQPGQLQPRPPSPPKQVPRPLHSSVNPSQVVAAFTEWRDNDSSDSDADGFTFLPLHPPPDGIIHGQQYSSLPHRFHGKSSGVVLVQKVMGMKRDHTGSSASPEDSTKQLLVKPHPWEEKVKDPISPKSFEFPPLDLFEHLIEVFFQCVNSFLPILHRPSFEASLRDGVHTRDAAFGAVVLLLCAAASRWSPDQRVLFQQSPDAEDKLDWSSAGWDFYCQVHERYRRNLLQSTSVLDLQIIALKCIYLQGTSNPSPPWQMAGLGLRLALDVGIHRRQRPEDGSLLETELWKRAFWILVVLDRINSANLGRPCAIWEEDIDIDLPLEIDDEYFTREAAVKQPPDKPSRIAYFNSLVKLTQVLIGALRTIYPINKASMYRLVGPDWEQDMVAALDSSLNDWIDNIPEHLRWDPNRNTGFFFYQSAVLRCTYYNVQIVVHRPYITSKPSALSFPSLAICTNAARSLSHILDVLLRRSTFFLPMLLSPAFTSAIVLLFNIWGTNKPGARMDWQSQVKDVHICMRFIQQCDERWCHAVKMRKIIYDLVSVGDFPLPASPPMRPGGHKRTRDSGDWPDLPHLATPATASSSSSDLEGNLTTHNYLPHGTGYPTGSGHPDFKREPLEFGDSQCPYFPSLDTSNLRDPSAELSLPRQQSGIEAVASNPYPNAVHDAYAFSQQQLEPRTQEAHSAHDVLTALDSAYLVDSTSSLGDGVVMDVAQHTCNVWGHAPNGFQWDEWQQFTNAVPQAGVTESAGEYTWSQFEPGYA